MRNATEVLYITLVTDNSDEAMSLSEYLNQHGFFAQQSEPNEITCPIDDPAACATIYDLRRTWKLFWEHSDSGLFGLPVSTGQLPIYVKDV